MSGVVSGVASVECAGLDVGAPLSWPVASGSSLVDECDS